MRLNFDLEAKYHSLESMTPQEVLSWAVDTFPEKVAVSSSFQTQSIPLLHIIATTVPGLPILFIDTGYHFPETIAFRDQLVSTWNLNLVVLKGEFGVEDGTNQGGQPLYLLNPDMCCNIRKVAPMREAVCRYHAWISGIRADQTISRAKARIVEDSGNGRIRIHPMLKWTQADVQAYVTEHRLPEHPLTALGYTSIGCSPCTRAPQYGEDPRSGRWVGSGKTECGLHTILRDPSKGQKNE